MELALNFAHYFMFGLFMFSPLLLSLAIVVLGLGMLVRRFEGWNRLDAVYWALITATTVGYGDIVPRRRRSKSLAIVIAFIGMILTGIVIAIGVQAAMSAFAEIVDINSIGEKFQSGYTR
ncbi:MAG: hypothetical protein DHS20C01_14260 [marine bacterium B5-7]|nr:MAG: hypothetical protein DHS20C01_14260 [marine bacterium B5-7]